MGHHDILALNSQPLLVLIQRLSHKEDIAPFFVLFSTGRFSQSDGCPHILSTIFIMAAE
jgi:hypothetical protein